MAVTLPFAGLTNRVLEFWAGLSQRERRLLSLVALVVGLAVLFTTGMSVRKGLTHRQQSLEEKHTAMQQVAILAATYRDAEAARARIEARIKGQPVRLFSYLEDLAKKQGVAIGDMQDRGSDTAGPGIQRSSVEVNFAQIDLRSLTNFLNEVEKSPHLVKIEKLRVRTRTDNPNQIDASLTVSTYTLTSG